MARTAARKTGGDTVSNLELWEKHFKPHKDSTKKFTGKGGFKGTAIDPMWLIRCATEEWGPMGSGWGVDIVEEKYFEFPTDPTTIIHVVWIKLWYESKDQFINSVGQTPMMTTRSGNPFVDEDAPKKSLTDAIAKALSWLGFGAAVHMGMFDGNKYVDLRPEEELKDEKPPEPEGDTPTIDLLKTNLKAIEEKFGREEAVAWHKRMVANFYDGVPLDEMTLADQTDYWKHIQTKLASAKEE